MHEKDVLLEGLKKRGFDSKVIDAFSRVKRENFVPDRLIGYEYEDISLPLAEGSTISQPSTIAFMLNLLDLHQGQKVLEIGSGSGYTLALISEIIKNGKIYGLEKVQSLAIKSKKLLSKDSNIEVINRDGYEGLMLYGPYDRIIASAAYDKKPYHLLEQLKDSGILVAPVHQMIIQMKKEKGILYEKEFPGFVFVPMIREH